MYTEDDENITFVSVKKKAILILIFFITTPVCLLSTIIFLLVITNQNHIQNFGNPNMITSRSGTHVYASLPTDNSYITTAIIEEDARPLILKKYLISQKSPLANHTESLVGSADKYGLDWRLLTAIAMKESGACRVIPEGSHNCWGWGIHSKGTLMFDNYPEAIDTVSNGLKSNYIDKGFVTVEDIMKKYAHPDSTTWAEGVLYYIESISDSV